MSLFTLPNSLRPGTDLMSKGIVRNPEVVNIITKALVKSQDEYIVGDSEWSNGTRSDLVFEPKAPMPESPPIVVEFQHTVNEEFMRRVTNYGLEASKRYKRSPIVLIVCINTMSSEIDQHILPTSRIPSCYTFPSQFWASECLILCESSIKKSSTIPPLDPFIALGLFLTHQATSIINSPYADDQTIKQLHNLAMEHYQSNAGSQLHLIDVLRQVFATQDREYERILELVNNHAPPETLSQAIGHAQSRNQDLKRKYIEIDNNNDNFVAQSTSSFSFQRSMEFVEKFKKARMEKGLKQMDWVTCLSEGKKMKLFNYKNTATLRSQFNKYMKNKN